MNKHFLFGVVGRNISYSKSPAIFETIFRVNGTAGEMRIYNIEPDRFEDEFHTIITSGNIQGLSITIPYKETVLPYLDSIDNIAKTIGAVNSIAIANSKTTGYNTDCFGFAYPLKSYRDNLKDGVALIVGYGGAARAVVYSLVTECGIRTIHITGRNINKLSQFKNAILHILPEIDIAMYSNSAREDQNRYDIIVNCTPLGGWHDRNALVMPEGLLWQHVSIYYDLNYSSDNINIIKAKQAEVVTFSGMPMLVAQAVRSYQLWTRRDVSVDEVMSAVLSQE